MARCGRRWFRKAGVVCACAASVAGCAQPAESPPRNLLLVTIDTLRPDHLGVYGYPRPTSPRLDRFAESAVVFERAYGTSSWTLPSIASLLTSEYPSGHGAVTQRSTLAPGFETLPERLEAAGFATAAVVSHVFFAHRFGLDQGIGDYDDDLVRQQLAESHAAISSPGVTAKGIAWLRARRRTGDDRPWFLWLHYFDPHAEYMIHPGVTEVFGDEPVDRYDGEIAFTDAHVGAVLDALRELHYADDTAVIVASDHGEAFGEHLFTGHRLSLHQEELRVVLMVHAPGIAPGRSSLPVSLVDVAPTALELLALPPLPPAAGVSLVPALRREAVTRPPLLAELRSALDWRRVDAVLVGPWKLMFHRVNGVSLFELSQDPGERRNVAREHPAVVRQLRRKLRDLRTAAEQRGAAVASPPVAPLDPETTRQLEALGYTEPEAGSR